MNFKLKVWRQKDGRSPGSFKDYDAKDIPSEASVLEMLDIVNETLPSRPTQVKSRLVRFRVPIVSPSTTNYCESKKNMATTLSLEVKCTE
jgi:hypothetical protein